MKINKKCIIISITIVIISIIVIALSINNDKEKISNGILVQEAKMSNENLEKNYNRSYKENFMKLQSLPIITSNTSVNNKVDLTASEQDNLLTIEATRSYLTEGGINKVRINIKANYVDGVKVTRLKCDVGEQDFDYMDQNGTTLSFSTSGNSVSSSFDIASTGKYTIFIEYQKDDEVRRKITVLTINTLVDPSSEHPKISINRNSENGRIVTINATNSSSKITEIKIQKINSKDENVDFSTQGTKIPITPSNNVTATYTVSEDGMYRIYAKAESGAYSTLTTVLVQKSAITTNIVKDADNGRKITITSTSIIDDIDTMKIAKASDVTGSDYFETNGTNINITPGRTVTATYVVPEDGTYIIYVKDKFGCSLRSQVILYEDEYPISISAQQDDDNDKLLHINASCSTEIIKEMKIASGRYQTDYFETGGTNLNITQGNNVKVDYTINSSGYYTIYAATDNMKYTYTIGINISETVNVESVSLNKSETTMTIGNTEKLTATINPSNATNKNVTWESDKPEIVKVDNEGNIEAVGVGEAVITVKTVDGNKTAQCRVTVKGIAVTGVSLNKNETTMTIGDTEKLTATINPSNATNKNVTWESDKPEIVKVDNEGNIEAVGVGEAVITVKTVDGNKTAQCIVTVEGIAVTGVSLNKNETTMTIGNTEKLTATINPSNATNKNVVWESDEPSIADVDNTGNITAKGIGTTTIRVRTVDGNKTAQCKVTVEGIAVTGVSLNRNETTMTIGNTEKLTATINPSNATNKNVTWESDKPDIVRVDNEGNITAVGVGETVITVKTVDGNKTAQCRVTVKGIAVTGVSLNKNETTMTIGNTEKLTATINPSNATNKNVVWESDKPDIVRVDNEGNIEAVGVGEAVITVKTVDGNRTAQCRVTVEGIAVTGVSLNKNETTMTIGNTEKLTATINPSNATNKNVTWESDKPDIVRVDNEGNIEAVGVGEAVITVKTVDGNRTAQCRVTVEGIAVTGVSLNKNETTMTIGNTEKLTATINPSNATNKNVTWESDKPDIVRVDNEGNIEAVGVGETVITVKTVDGNKTAQCRVTVKGIAVTGVSLNKNETTMTIGNTEKLTATINPSNATNKNVTWESDKPDIVRVDNEGNIEAVGVGEAVITVKTVDGNRTAQCRVTVEGIAVTGVSLNKNETTMTIGNTEKLTATINPSNATNKNVVWESDKPDIVRVDNEGNITAVGVGEAVITVKTVDGNKTAQCKVTVEGIAVTGVSLNKNETTMTIGNTEKLTATINPSNATNKAVTWESTNTNVATVDSTGKITAVGVGEATIRVTTIDGEYTAECKVTVEEIVVKVTGVSLNKSETTMTIGNTEQLIATINPSNATNKNVRWESTNTNVATVDSTGKITAVGVGEATIRVTTIDGEYISECRITVNGGEEPEKPYEIIVDSQLQSNNTEATIKITIAGDSSKINIIKIGKGSLNIDYFKNNGGQILDINNNIAQIKVTENSIYTIYIEDIYGNVNLKEINITGIQQPPENPDDNNGDNNNNGNNNNENSDSNQNNNQGNGNNSNINQNTNNNEYYVDKLPYTGKTNNTEYFIITIVSIAILTAGTILIRKYVII